jgi:AcrR family transcriptional regulator
MLSNPPIEKEDPRITRTRSLILNAFTELLPEKGFQSLTVQNITEGAGVNRATFYAHFPDKYALLDFSIQQMFRQEIEKRTLNACHYSDENLLALIMAVCEFVAKTHSHCSSPESQFESLIETQVKNQLQELLQKWLEQVGSDLDSKTAATAASWAIYGLVLQWSRDKSKNRPSAEQFAEQIFPLIAVNLGEKQKAAY